MLAIEFKAMGCHMQALAQPLGGNKTAMSQALENIPWQFSQAEAHFSRFLDSELMQLNTKRTLQLSDPLWQMLRHSVASARLTQGLITPTILPKLIERGYQASFNGNSFIHNTTTFLSKSETSINQWQAITFEPTTRSITLLGDVMLDLGGFAKGLTAWQIATDINQLTQDKTILLIDAGGDIVTVASRGLKEQNEQDREKFCHWHVELPSASDINLTFNALPTVDSCIKPRNWQQIKHPIAINLPQRSMMLATSGIDYRHWYQDNKLHTHLVNLNDDEPSDIVCASVLIELDDFTTSHSLVHYFLYESNVCNLAQTLGKLCCLMGFKASLVWLSNHQLEQIGLSFIVVTADGFEQWINPVMAQYLAA